MTPPVPRCQLMILRCRATSSNLYALYIGGFEKNTQLAARAKRATQTSWPQFTQMLLGNLSTAFDLTIISGVISARSSVV